MTKYTPRHAKTQNANNPLSQQPTNTASATLAVSAAGTVLASALSPQAIAAPHHLNTESPSDTSTVLVAIGNTTTVQVPDIAWQPTDEVSASAQKPPERRSLVQLVSERDSSNRSSIRDGLEETNLPDSGYQLPPINAAGNDIVSIAAQLTGIPYVYGGSTPAGFDCSGFTQYVYAQAGIHIPRTSYEQGAAGTPIPASEARPGDIVWEPGHVAIYAGDGMIIEATVPGDVTRISPIRGYAQFIRY